MARLAEKRLGAQPDEIVFVDNHEPHVLAAQECGWRGVVHRDTSATIRQLCALLGERPDAHAV